MPFALALAISVGAQSVAGLVAVELPITAPAALLMDAESGAILYGRDIDRARPPASTTKILTAILLAESTYPSETIKADKQAASTRESSMHLKFGEVLSSRQLMHAILMRSANDGCVAAAVHVSGSVSKFAAKMNLRAKELGCTNFHFTNPHGLPDPDHLVSAHDLALLGLHALQYPLIREVVSKQKHELTRSINQKDRMIENRNKLLAMDPTIDGIKTGWTRAAGHCFVGSATRGDKKLITVVMNSEDWKADTMRLLDWGTVNFDRLRLTGVDEAFGEVPIADSNIPLMAITKENIYRLVERETTIRNSISFKPDLVLPIVAGSEVGTITFTDGTGWSKTAKLYAKDSIDKQELTAFSSAGFIAIGLGIVGAYSALRYRRQQIYGRLTNSI